MEVFGTLVVLVMQLLLSINTCVECVIDNGVNLLIRSNVISKMLDRGIFDIARVVRNFIKFKIVIQVILNMINIYMFVHATSNRLYMGLNTFVSFIEIYRVGFETNITNKKHIMIQTVLMQICVNLCFGKYVSTVMLVVNVYLQVFVLAIIREKMLGFVVQIVQKEIDNDKTPRAVEEVSNSMSSVINGVQKFACNVFGNVARKFINGESINVSSLVSSAIGAVFNLNNDFSNLMNNIVIAIDTRTFRTKCIKVIGMLLLTILMYDCITSYGSLNVSLLNITVLIGYIMMILYKLYVIEYASSPEVGLIDTINKIQSTTNTVDAVSSVLVRLVKRYE